MKIITWNCNGAFREKYKALLKLQADIWVIQECESPEYLVKKGIFLPVENTLWHGTRAYKGLGVFTFNKIKLEKSPHFNPEYHYILPTKIKIPTNDEIILNAVWASTVPNKSDWDYIGQMCHFAQHHSPCFQKNSITLGDFNINMQWNQSFKKEHNYEKFLELMKNLKQDSLYHQLNNIPQGKETTATSYYRRNPNCPFHIDYIYVGKNIFTHLKKFKIYNKEWLQYSDHVPLEIEI